MKVFSPRIVRWFVDAGPAGPPGDLIPRWLFLRALGVIYFSAFYSLLFQIRGLLGPDGLLPAGSYLSEGAKVMGRARFWYAPTLLWLGLLWFTIYFESGVAKFFGGDPTWRNLSAMNEYYQNGPLLTWIGWYAHQLPRWFHQATALVTLLLELVVPWMLWLPRRAKIICFLVVTILQVGIILTANYAFLNYLVLALGIFLVDDLFLVQFIPKSWQSAIRANLERPPSAPWQASLRKSFAGSTERISLSLAGSTDEANEKPVVPP